MTTTTANHINNAVSGRINGFCELCDTFGPINSDWNCDTCTEPTVEPYTNHLGHTGLRVAHPANDLPILITEKNGKHTAWWSDSITTLASGSEDYCLDVAKVRITRAR